MANILHVTAVTGNYPHGQFIDQARITYDCSLSKDVKADSFSIEGRSVTGVQVEGDTVVLSLSNVREQAASLFPPMPPRPKPKPGEKIGGPPRNMPPTKLLPIQVTVTQVGEIFDADNNVIMPDGAMHVSDRTIQPVVEEFTQGEFAGIPYNLYTPKNMEPGKVYPLVMFIHDAGPCGPDPKITLAQGNGAISFASPEWQREHPCFVLAPQIDRSVHLTNDDFTCSKEIHDIKDLLDYVVDSNAVDKSRIYTTGQSMGCMASCELNILYPDLFAASMLVAGQWDPDGMARTYNGNKYWILVSEHDAKAFPGMNAVTDALEGVGVEVAKYRWNGKASGEELTELARNAVVENDAKVRYTVFQDSTVVPEWEEDGPGSNHVNTWPVVYNIIGLKEWLFSQSK